MHEAGVAREAQCAFAGEQCVQDTGRVEAVADLPDAAGVGAVQPTANGGCRHDRVAVDAQPAGQPGDRGPGTPQGEQFRSVAVEPRPARCRSHVLRSS